MCKFYKDNDRAGYFVIIPKAQKGVILVEEYNYANQLLRVIQGDNARDIYWMIIDNNWITDMSHAAYLGKELAAAQLSCRWDLNMYRIKLDYKYTKFSNKIIIKIYKKTTFLFLHNAVS